MVLSRFAILLSALLLTFCGHPDKDLPGTSLYYPDIFPDYVDVTVPADIAPLNFRVSDNCNALYIVVSGKRYRIEKRYSGCKVILPAEKWHRLLEDSAGDTLKIEVFVKNKSGWLRYKPFNIIVAAEPIDEYLVYRNLMPGFQNWNQMGIYQRSLSDYRVTTLLDSRLMPGTCMNCHSFNRNDPESLVLHLRENYGGTIIFNNNQLEKLNTRTDKMFANAAFPYWHPSGKFIAFSVNRINQIFHAKGPTRATAVDLRSDIFIYDMEKNEMITSPLLSAEDNFETFPCFSPDGNILYFCSADHKKLPGEYDQMKYSLCSISFDFTNRSFGTKTDTLISSAETGKSISIPRISPNGKFIMFTMSDFGCFPSFNPEADLWILNLENNEYYNVDTVNSNYTESYHSWSSNGHWVVFSSRRIDGLYMNIYFAFVDEDGLIRKPFLLPQRNPDFYDKFLFSFNIPEFVTKKVSIDPYEIEKVAKSTKTIQAQTGSSH